MKVYLIGSLRNPEVPLLGNKIRALGFEVFDEWHGAGERADDSWQLYEETRGRSYRDALYESKAAQNTFDFDLRNMNDSDIGVLLLPAGKSAHIELGYLVGRSRKTFALFNEVPARWDLMMKFCDDIFFTQRALLSALRKVLDKEPT